jgi:ankyrin repeat protein
MAKGTFLDIFFFGIEDLKGMDLRESLVKKGSKLTEYVLGYNEYKTQLDINLADSFKVLRLENYEQKLLKCIAEYCYQYEQTSSLSNVNRKLLESTVGLYIYKDFPEVAKFMILELGCNINSLQEQMNGSTPLFEAVHVNNLEMTQWLLDNKADVNTGSRADESPLHRAAHEGFVAVGELLLAYKADPNIRDAKGRTPIQKALLGHKKSDLIETLAKQENIELNNPNPEGLFPIHQAVGLEDPQTIKTLVRYKADVNAKMKNAHGLPPLHLAISLSAANVKAHYLSGDEYKTINTLIESGADPKITNAKGYDAYRHTESMDRVTSHYTDYLGIDCVQPYQRLGWAKSLRDYLGFSKYHCARHDADEGSEMMGVSAAASAGTDE